MEDRTAWVLARAFVCALAAITVIRLLDGDPALGDTAVDGIAVDGTAVDTRVLDTAEQGTDADDRTRRTTTTTTMTTTTTTLIPCVPTAAAGPSEGVLVTADGRSRGYRLHVPPQPGRHPLVIDLHGLGSSAAEQEELSGFVATADERGVVVVTPEGTEPASLGLGYWNTATGSPSTVDPGLDVDDVDFLVALVDELTETACVDPGRVLATGISNGAYLAARLACDRPDRFTAIAPVAAALHPADCASTLATPVLAFHGTDDPIVPYAGGPEVVRRFHPIDEVVAEEAMAEWAEPVEEEIAQWAAHDGCDAEPGITTVEDERRIVYGGCDQPVALVAIDGGGHEWPDGATARILDWFLTLPTA